MNQPRVVLSMLMLTVIAGAMLYRGNVAGGGLDALLTGALFGFAIGWYAVRPAGRSAGHCRRPHDHRLVVINAKPLEVEGALAYKQTVVLRRCARCGFHFSMAYAGSWSISDFLVTESEVVQLKRMVEL